MHWSLRVALIGAIAWVVLRTLYRIASPFWSRQPVFHPYRLDLWFRRGVMCNQLPTPDRYVDRTAIRWLPVSGMDAKRKSELSSFISKHFLRSPQAVYSPDWKHIAMGMEGSHRACVFCAGVHRYGGIVSAISARPLTLRLPGLSPFDLYYIDNLCVHTGHRKTGLAPKTIRTLYQYIREEVKEVRVYLFKREGAGMGIMPLTVMEVTVYQVGALRSLAARWASDSLYTPKTRNGFRDIWSTALELADESRVLIHMPIAAAIRALEDGTLYAYGAKSENGDIVGVAVFREPACTYEGDRSVELAAVVHTLPKAQAARFMARACLQAAADTSAKLVVVDGCGRAGDLQTGLRAQGRQPVFSSKTSLFLYNYAERPYSPVDCTLLF